MYGRTPSPAQLTEGQGDDALPAAGSTRDDHDTLVLIAARLLHLVQNDVEGELLFVQQYELLAHPDFVGSDGQQLLARCDP